MSFSAIPSSLPQLPCIADNILSSCVELNNFDSGLRCPICYDYYSTPMMLINCSHNYCSVCIRRTLSFRSICPTCNKAATVNDLKFNRSLDFLTKSFQQFQKQFDFSANKYFQNNNNFIINNNIQDDDELDVIPNPSPHNPKQERNIKDLLKSQSSHSQRKQTQPEKVLCPICLISVVTSAINTHLDSCLANPNNTAELALEPVSVPNHNLDNGITTNSTNTAISRPSRLLPVAYNLMNDKQIRELLRKVNLPISGSRDDLIRRHREYLLLSAAALDAVNPPSEQEIIKTILKKEKEKSIVTANKAHKQGDLFSAFTNLNQSNNSNQGDKFRIANNYSKITTKQAKTSPNHQANKSLKRKHDETDKSVEPNTINLVDETHNKENEEIEEIFDLTESKANNHSDSDNINNTENINNNDVFEVEIKDNNLNNSHTTSTSHSSSRSALFAQLTAKLRAQQAERKRQKQEEKLKQEKIQQEQQQQQQLQEADIDLNIENQSSLNPSKTIFPLTVNPPIPTSDWRAIWSIQHQKVFYWNQKTLVGQFHPPTRPLDQEKYGPIYEDLVKRNDLLMQNEEK